MSDIKVCCGCGLTIERDLNSRVKVEGGIEQ